MVKRLFLTMPRVCLQFVIVVFPDHTHLLFFIELKYRYLQTRQADLKTPKTFQFLLVTDFYLLKNNN